MQKLRLTSCLALVLTVTVIMVLGACGQSGGTNEGGAATTAPLTTVAAAATTAEAEAEAPTTLAAETSASAITEASTTAAATSATAQTAGAQTNSTDNDTSLLVNPDWAEPLTVRFASTQVRDGVDYNDCNLSRYFADRYNIQWEMIPLTWANWGEMLRIWINSGDMPDMATWDYVHGEALTFARDGLVRRLPDGWEEKWPNVYSAVQASGIGPAVADIVGGYYFLHKAIFVHNKPTDPLVGHTVMYMRKDWMDALGVESKPAYTMSELIDIAIKFRDEDPGGLGSSLVPMSLHSSSATSNFVGSQIAMSNNSAFFTGDDGLYHWTLSEPEILTGLKLYQQAYREGLFHPDFYLWSSDEDRQYFRTVGVGGMMSQEGMSIIVDGVMQDLAGLGLTQNDLNVATMLGEDGYFHQMETINFWTAAIFSPKLSEADFERIMYLADFTAQADTQLIIRMGFEGEHWKREGDEIIPLVPTGTNMWEIHPSIEPLWGNFLVLSDDFVQISPVITPWAHAITNEMYALKDRMSTPKTVIATDWDLYFQDSTARSMSNINTTNAFTELIMMDGDLETNWLNWVEAQKPLIDPVIAELNAMKK